jgi:hypothetical protein
MNCSNIADQVNGFVVSPVREIRTLGSNEGGVRVTGSSTLCYRLLKGVKPSLPAMESERGGR